MRNFTIYLAVTLCVFLNKINAQETFEERAKSIASKIESITKDEKSALKTEVEAVNQQLINGTITKDEADSKKKKLAEARAINIESKVALAEEELKNLVQEKVDGKIKERDTTRTFQIVWNSKKNWKNKKEGESRTTSQFVFAMGLNNLVTNGSAANSDFRYWGSHFYEWGFTENTRIFKNSNLLHFKYGFSVMYNNLRPTDNRVFEVTGNQTNLVKSPINLDDSRFKNVYLVAPLHLEFDFSGKKNKDGKDYFTTHKSARIGLGGYLGANLKSKQYLEYDDNGDCVKQKTKGNFNTSDFIYGVSAYVGYKETSLYVKYDLNPLFKDNVVKQNNISLGIRWDFN
jgi:hypothetical protein